MQKISNKYPAIYLDGFVYLVDKNNIKPKSWFFNVFSDNKRTLFQNTSAITMTHDTLEGYVLENIVATNDPSLEGVPKIGELSTNKTAFELFAQLKENMSAEKFSGYLEGYKSASKKKWSDEDMMRAIHYVANDKYYNNALYHTTDYVNKVLQSLTPKIKEIELAVEEYDESKYIKGSPTNYSFLKLDDKGYVIIKNIVYE